MYFILIIFRIIFGQKFIYTCTEYLSLKHQVFKFSVDTSASRSTIPSSQSFVMSDLLFYLMVPQPTVGMHESPYLSSVFSRPNVLAVLLRSPTFVDNLPAFVLFVYKRFWPLFKSSFFGSRFPVF